MLADLEWMTPHLKPNGKTVAEWVEEVRGFEAEGWLGDPALIDWPADPKHAANRRQRAVGKACLALCWRERCHRAFRCRHHLPLAVREFMPEFAFHMAALGGWPPPFYNGEMDQAKLALLAEILTCDAPGAET